MLDIKGLHTAEGMGHDSSFQWRLLTCIPAQACDEMTLGSILRTVLHVVHILWFVYILLKGWPIQKYGA